MLDSGDDSLLPDAIACDGAILDLDAMKKNVSMALAKGEGYDVTKLYHETGVWQQIAKHRYFEQLTLFVICLNAAWMWVDTDLNKAEVFIHATPTFQIAEHCFCLYFAFEWFVRFKSFKKKWHGLTDGWFVFDSCLVFSMVAETWVMTSVMLFFIAGAGGGLGNASILRMARLLRLSRMARMARLFRAMPELLVLIKGIVAAMRSVVMTLVLLSLIVYVFGIAFRQLVGSSVTNDQGDAYFGTVSAAMHTLLLYGTLLDGVGALVKALEKESFVYVIMLFAFVMLSAYTVLNMLIGVLCEVVGEVASTEQENLTREYLISQLKRLAPGGLDANDDGRISKDEFLKLVDVPDVCKVLDDVGVDVVSLIDNVDFIFADRSCFEEEEEEERALTLIEFADELLSLRGCNTATVKDIVEVRKRLTTTFQRLRDDTREARGGRRRSTSRMSRTASTANFSVDVLRNLQGKEEGVELRISTKSVSTMASSKADVPTLRGRSEGMCSGVFSTVPGSASSSSKSAPCGFRSQDGCALSSPLDAQHLDGIAASSPLASSAPCSARHHDGFAASLPLASSAPCSARYRVGLAASPPLASSAPCSAHCQDGFAASPPLASSAPCSARHQGGLASSSQTAVALPCNARPQREVESEDMQMWQGHMRLALALADAQAELHKFMSVLDLKDFEESGITYALPGVTCASSQVHEGCFQIAPVSTGDVLGPASREVHGPRGECAPGSIGAAHDQLEPLMEAIVGGLDLLSFVQGKATATA